MVSSLLYWRKDLVAEHSLLIELVLEASSHTILPLSHRYLALSLEEAAKIDNVYFGDLKKSNSFSLTFLSRRIERIYGDSEQASRISFRVIESCSE
jgi:hypothetical protein